MKIKLQVERLYGRNMAALGRQLLRYWPSVSFVEICIHVLSMNILSTEWTLFYTQRNLFKILSNQTEIRLYLLFSDWFGTKRTFVWFQINLKMITTIWFRFDLIRFWKYFSVCNISFVGPVRLKDMILWKVNVLIYLYIYDL